MPVTSSDCGPILHGMETIMCNQNDEDGRSDRSLLTLDSSRDLRCTAGDSLFWPVSISISLTSTSKAVVSCVVPRRNLRCSSWGQPSEVFRG
jgi:hypothetical protein